MYILDNSNTPPTCLKASQTKNMKDISEHVWKISLTETITKLTSQTQYPPTHVPRPLQLLGHESTELPLIILTTLTIDCILKTWMSRNRVCELRKRVFVSFLWNKSSHKPNFSSFGCHHASLLFIFYATHARALGDIRTGRAWGISKEEELHGVFICWKRQSL